MRNRQSCEVSSKGCEWSLAAKFEDLQNRPTHPAVWGGKKRCSSQRTTSRPSLPLFLFSTWLRPEKGKSHGRVREIRSTATIKQRLGGKWPKRRVRVYLFSPVPRWRSYIQSYCLQKRTIWQKKMQLSLRVCARTHWLPVTLHFIITKQCIRNEVCVSFFTFLSRE